MMLYADLRDSEPTVTSDDPDELADAIAQLIYPHVICTHMTLATGGPASCRVFLPAPAADAISLPKHTYTPCSLARELQYFTANEEARYPIEHSPTAKKGWEIRPVELEGVKGVAATAKWI